VVVGRTAACGGEGGRLYGRDGALAATWRPRDGGDVASAGWRTTSGQAGSLTVSSLFLSSTAPVLRVTDGDRIEVHSLDVLDTSNRLRGRTTAC